MVGTSRGSLNRQLHEFAERGWLVAGRGLVVVRDPDRLAAGLRRPIDAVLGPRGRCRRRVSRPVRDY